MCIVIIVGNYDSGLLLLRNSWKLGYLCLCLADDGLE